MDRFRFVLFKVDIMEWMGKYNIILASKSPRRQHLLKEAGFSFIVKNIEVDEHYPPELQMEEIPVYLAELKAKPFEGKLNDNDLLITADTIVWARGQVLCKPSGAKEASEMLRFLSNNKHQVVTGVCLKTNRKQKSFYSVSDVVFKNLSDQEITYYINKYKPFDKAGAYGIQEWIGYIGVSNIEGSFFNVMGLPIQKLYCELEVF